MGIDHAVDARRRGRELHMAQDRGAAGRERAGAGQRRKVHRSLELRKALLVVLLDQFGRRVDVFFGNAHGWQRKS